MIGRRFYARENWLWLVRKKLNAQEEQIEDH